jgi:hypothetical protein
MVRENDHDDVLWSLLLVKLILIAVVFSSTFVCERSIGGSKLEATDMQWHIHEFIPSPNTNLATAGGKEER